MNPENFDPIANAFCFDGANVPAEETEVPPDVIGQLFENARFDAAMASPGSASALAVESSRFTRKREANPNPPAEDSRLEKTGFAETGIVTFLKSEMAAGRTALQGVENWRRDNPSRVTAALTARMENLAIALDSEE